MDDTHFLLGGGADVKVNDWFTVRGEIGLVFGQEYRVEKKRGNEVGTIDGDDTGFFIGLQAILAF